MSTSEFTQLANHAWIDDL
ncbi:hypothetical protein CGLO_00510 [Colletotrichum gloeosporioides Cg-14]|uniref:Uncharacterized protein n=1 Tax=Colletotrichum gloeosporioides (strain Cg-14) TaxID=1237896 RepID=T0L305_COLGC|nr:hypothetical protein CGLO_00510 [Colletotrichum gloeosporioides Cg-14]